MNYFHACPHCGKQFPINTVHVCSSMRSDLFATALALDVLIEFGPGDGLSGAGLLWLYRVAYRINSQLNGLQKYKDRAALARLACELGGELIK